jgi:hypothetical protein
MNFCSSPGIVVDISAIPGQEQSEAFDRHETILAKSDAFLTLETFRHVPVRCEICSVSHDVETLRIGPCCGAPAC